MLSIHHSGNQLTCSKRQIKMFVWYFFTINNIFMDLEKQFCLQGSKRKFNSRSNSVETTHVFWKRCKCQPRVLNVKKTRCSLASSMRSEALYEQITSGDVSGCVAFWLVKSPLSKGREGCLRRVLANPHLLHWPFTIWSIDSCQNRIATDQYHIAISGAHVSTHQGDVSYLEAVR